MSRPLWTHRGFLCTGITGGWKAEHLLWRMFLDLPKAFKWPSDDRHALCDYIDALYRTEYHRENAHLLVAQAQDVQMPDANWYEKEGRPQPGPSTARRLFDCLELRDRWDVPLWGRVRFVTNGSRLVAANFIGALLAVDPAAFTDVESSTEWRDARHLEDRYDPASVTSGMYLKGFPQPAPEATTPVASNPSSGKALPRERTLRRLDRGDYIDWLTETVPDAGARWYTHRLHLVSQDQRIIYSATSWTPNGPWTVWERDLSAMLALGVDL